MTRTALAQSSRSLSLRIRLILLVIACVLPLFAFGFGSAYSDYQSDRADAGNQALIMARTLALMVQRDLEARLDMLQALALSGTLQNGGLTSFRAAAETVLARQMPKAHILLLQEDGRQVMNTGLPPGAPLPTRHDVTSLRQLFTTAQPSVSDVFIGALSNQPVIALEVPVFRPDGSVIYSLTLNPSNDAFAEIVHRQHLNTGAIVSILDRNDIIIARTPNDDKFVGKKVGSALLPRLTTQAEGFAEITSQDGIPVVAAFSHVPVFGWSVTVGFPRAGVIDTAKHATLVTLSVGVCCLLLGIALAQIMAQRIARPIASLRALSAALEQGLTNLSIQTGLTETDDVAKALAASLHKRQVAEAASRRAEQAREQASALLRTVVETAPSLIYARDRAGRIVLTNDAYLSVLGRSGDDVVGKTDLEFREDQDEAAKALAADCQIMTADRTESFEEAIGWTGNHPRFWLTTKTPLRNAQKEIIGLVGMSVEITERKRIEDRLRLMVNELNHRVKNTLATVQSIASQTLRGTEYSIKETLDARLLALASAHDVLTRENWEGANLIDVVAGALAPYGGIQGGRFRISGPPLRLLPRAGVAVAMGFHELATNAIKYGALSIDDGYVRVQWMIVKDETPYLEIVWSEQKGPPVSSPVSSGFGTRLIERSLAQDLGGTAQIVFAPDGVTCVIKAPIAEVIATAAVVAFPRFDKMR